MHKLLVYTFTLHYLENSYGIHKCINIKKYNEKEDTKLHFTISSIYLLVWQSPRRISHSSSIHTWNLMFFALVLNLHNRDEGIFDSSFADCSTRAPTKK